MTALAQPRPKRWTAHEFDRLVELGAFDGQRLELINGELLEMPPMSDAHAHAVQLAQYALLAIFPASTHTVRVQSAMKLPSGSRPEPDIAVVAGTPRETAAHPSSALLVVEVADSMLDFDRVEKAELFARNGLPEYWIVNLQDRCVEVHRQPERDGSGVGRYAGMKRFASTDTLVPIAAPGASLRVADLLP
jgi:Uma2 family endonuclease